MCELGGLQDDNVGRMIRLDHDAALVETGVGRRRPAAALHLQVLRHALTVDGVAVRLVAQRYIEIKRIVKSKKGKNIFKAE